MRSQKGALVALSATALLLASLSPVAAKPPQECAAEVDKYCQDVPEGAGRIFVCLEKHQSQLSQPCQQAMSQRQHRAQKGRTRRQRPGWASPCMGDIAKLCKGIPAGAGRIAECLKQHEAELSIACKSVFPPKAKQ
jgi:Cysteine rich repeat